MRSDDELRALTAYLDLIRTHVNIGRELGRTQTCDAYWEDSPRKIREVSLDVDMNRAI